MTNSARRIPPHDLMAEAHLLGAAMLDAGALAVVADVPAEDFYRPAHAHLADALQELHERGEPVDPVTVAHHLAQTGVLEVVGGHQALVDLMATVPATSNADRHAQIVRDRAALRRLLGVAGEIAELAYTAGDAADAANRASELIADAAGHADAAGAVGRLRLTPASSVTIDRPAWAWVHRIPLAGVTLVPGREGEGKTALVGHIAARLTRGDLPGDRRGRPGDVIYIGHEDDRATVLVPRLVAAGADLDRFWFIDLPTGAPFTIAVDIAALARQAADRDVAAIVLDPLDAHLGVNDTHKKADVQAAIARLASLTQQLRCAGIGIAHLNKGDSRDVLLKVVGSVGLTTAVRSVLAVGPNPQAPDVEKVAVVRKANMTNAADIPAVRFSVEGTTIDHPVDRGPVTTARIVILGEAPGINADAILDPADREQRTALDQAVDWLDAVLADGAMPRSEVVTLARAEGIAERTLERAAERLQVVVERDTTSRGRPAWWRHPDGADFPPSISRQPPMAGNHPAADQAEQTSIAGFPPTPPLGGKPQTNGTSHALDGTP